MTRSDVPFPVVDVFAGPGGLGEGFAAFAKEGKPQFAHDVSIEKDAKACGTLKLRKFFRSFPEGRVPDDYYQLLRGEIALDELYARFPRQAEHAEDGVWCTELGIGTHIATRDRLADRLPSGGDWVLLGGPPCQPFSNIGRVRNRRNTKFSGALETRHELYLEYLNIIADFAPAVFVMENVQGILSARFNGERVFPRIMQDLQDPASAIEAIPGRSALTKGSGYSYRLHPLGCGDEAGGGLDPADASSFLVKCEAHGIPQRRHRVILLGVRNDVVGTPTSLQRSSGPSLSSVLKGLPRLRSSLRAERSLIEWQCAVEFSIQSPWFFWLREHQPEVAKRVEAAAAKAGQSQSDAGGEHVPHDLPGPSGPVGAWYVDQRIGGACNHAARTHMRSDLHRYLFAACWAATHGVSPRLHDFPPSLLPKHKNVRKNGQRSHFADRFRVQVASQPSTTVVSHIAKDGHYYIHPDAAQCRSLTVREAARLQTFPDNYFFVGNRTEQYHQVGNAVPPLLARQIAEIVSDLLNDRGGDS